MCVFALALGPALADDDDDDGGPKTRTVKCDKGKSIQKKLDKSKPGDTVVVRGVCTENITMSVPGVTLMAEAAGDGITAASSNVITVRTIDVTISGLTITGGSTGIAVLRGGSASISGNHVSGASGTGIVITHNSYGRIVGNTSTGNGSDGAVVRQGSGADVHGNNLNSNGDDGLSVQASAVDADGNEMKDNDDEGLESVNSRVNLSQDSRTGVFSDLPNTMTGNGNNGLRCVSYSSISTGGVKQDFGDISTNTGGDFGGGLCVVFDLGNADPVLNSLP